MDDVILTGRLGDFTILGLIVCHMGFLIDFLLSSGVIKKYVDIGL
jgi:hypothetical protein